MKRTKPINPNKNTKESYGTSKYPHSRELSSVGLKATLTVKESKVIQLIRKESLHKLQERNHNSLISKPRPRKIRRTRGMAGWGKRGGREGRKEEWSAGTPSERSPWR